MKKPLAVKSDHKLTFDHYVKSLCKRANAKLKSLTKFVPYMGLVKKKNSRWIPFLSRKSIIAR